MIPPPPKSTPLPCTPLFRSTVNVAGVGSGLTITCTSATLAANGTATSTCTVSSSTPGLHSATITATAATGTASHSLTITVHVGDFTVSAASSDISFNTGASTTDALTLTSTQNFVGGVNVAGTLSGLTITCTSATLAANGTATSTCTISSSTPGIYSLTVTATAATGTASHAVTIIVHVGDFTVSAASSDISFNTGASTTDALTLTSTQNFAGGVNVAGTLSGLTVTCTSATLASNGTATSPCSISSSTPRIYSLTVTATAATGTASHAVTIIVHVGDFSISASPQSGNVGASLTSTITLTSTQNWAGTVNLSDVVPSGLSFGALSATSVTLTANSTSSTTTLTCTSSTAGQFTVVVTGAAATGFGTASHPANAIFTFGQPPGFSLSATGSSFNSGATGSTTITVTSIRSFTGAVTFTGTSNPSGVTVSGCTTANVPAGGTATATCNLTSTIGGIYAVTLTGSGGSPTVTNSTVITVHVGDFTVSAASSNISFNTGASTTDVLTLTSTQNFAGSVNVAGVGAGLTITCTSATLAANGTATSTCTISSSTPGLHSVTLTATAVTGTASHSLTIIVHVGDFTVSAASSDISFNTGASTTDALTLTSTQNFAGGVNVAGTLSGLTVTCTSATLAANGTATSTCTISSSTPGDRKSVV